MHVAPVADAGYARMPRNWILLPVSPGAKVLLLQFCSAANENGESWYSYEQLANFVGRSRASISSYVEELREAGVLRTIRQKTANGYNYRLKVILEGWREMLEGWSTRSKRSAERKETSENSAKNRVQDTECRVQQAERKDPTGPNEHNQKYHSRPAAGAVRDQSTDRTQPDRTWSSADEAAWKEFRPSDRDPISSYGRLPAKELREKLDETIASLEAKRPSNSQLGRSQIQQAFQAFCVAQRLRPAAAELDHAIDFVSKKASCHEHLEKLMDRLEAVWQPHWRRLSTPEQLEKLLGDVGSSISPIDAQINRFRSRAMIYDMVARKQRRD